MRILLLVMAGVVGAFAATGCAVQNCCDVTYSGSLADTPPGPSAVLRVTSVVPANGMAHSYVAGRIDPPNAAGQFAELLAHAARDDAGIEVLLPYQVADQLAKAELEPTLEPSAEQIAQYVQVLGCASYLEANVERWRSGYTFVFSSAEITCSLACRLPDGTLVWEATVHAQQRNTGDREIARLALYEAFKHMANQGVGPE